MGGLVRDCGVQTLFPRRGLSQPHPVVSRFDQVCQVTRCKRCNERVLPTMRPKVVVFILSTAIQTALSLTPTQVHRQFWSAGLALAHRDASSDLDVLAYHVGFWRMYGMGTLDILGELRCALPNALLGRWQPCSSFAGEHNQGVHPHRLPDPVPQRQRQCARSGPRRRPRRMRPGM